ncbi:MAG: HAMP domain-containing histidine kinase [Dysgonamonadaceae bacterium]|jgi:signal transduction histidine kinase|nr:HAMP domain-containing histidine kinase [Dysgonamonadaceae bacterium]
MRKSAIWLLTGVMIFTFTGLLYLQANYIYIIVINQKNQFKESVKRSLFQVAHDLELEETTRYLNDQIIPFQKKYLGKKQRISRLSTIIDPQELSIAPADRLSSKIAINEELEDPLIISPSFGKSDINPATKAMQEIMDNYLYHLNLLDEVISNVIRSAGDKPMEERVDLKNLENYIRTELSNNNLTLPFNFAVLDNEKNVVYQSPDYAVNSKNVYSQILFPRDPPNKLHTLQVVFPAEGEYLLNSVRLIIPSIVFTIVLLIVFTLTLFIEFRQKRLSEMKNDFINNMTHELKTPVASISLAAQTLNDSDVNNSPQLMSYAKTVITDESKRLGFLVEKVLQMSLFEDGRTQFKMTGLDANDLIASIANTFALRVENAGGKLDIELEALESTIIVDKMHFTNVLFNLMENAVKYRRENAPLELIAKTANAGDKILITIQDNGIGIKKEDQKKIFDRFYRVHTGNRHDVKGFGLGLAYVKRIITELEGTIKVESEYGQGTRFIISLPYLKN